MKRILLLGIILLSFIVTIGCSENNKLTVQLEDLEAQIEHKNATQQDFEKQIVELQNELEEYKAKVNSFEIANDNFPVLSNIALEFVRAHIKGDVKKLQSLVSKDITLLEENNKIYGIYEAYGEEIKILLYDSNREAEYQDMVIQGYGYNKENDRYRIHLAEFYKGESFGGIFLNLTIKELKEGWKVTEFEFDI